MATVTELFSGSAAITCSASTLANNAARESAAIDNSANLYLDALVQIALTVASGGVATGTVVVYAAASVDGGTTWGGECTGADAAITPDNPPNLVPLGVIATPTTTGGTFKSQPLSVAQAFGGTLPQRWSIVVQNLSGAALSAFNAQYQGVKTSVA